MSIIAHRRILSSFGQNKVLITLAVSRLFPDYMSSRLLDFCRMQTMGTAFTAASTTAVAAGFYARTDRALTSDRRVWPREQQYRHAVDEPVSEAVQSSDATK